MFHVCLHLKLTLSIISSKGFGGASSSLNFSARLTGNECPHTELRENDLDNLRFELAKVIPNSQGWGVSAAPADFVQYFSLTFTQTEDEIQTLRQVLLAKEKYAADIRSQLGMGPLSNVKQNLSKGWQEVQTSSP